jgi:hypothetical protein
VFYYNSHVVCPEVGMSFTEAVEYCQYEGYELGWLSWNEVMTIRTYLVPGARYWLNAVYNKTGN